MATVSSDNSPPTTLRNRIQEDMKAAMRARDQRRLDAIRLIFSSVKQVEIDARTTGATLQESNDQQVLATLEKMVKQRRESIKQYEAANRQTLADQEAFEISVIQAYMPTPLTETEIDTLIDETIKSLAASSIKDLGKVIAALKPQVQGKADMGVVTGRVKQKLVA